MLCNAGLRVTDVCAACTVQLRLNFILFQAWWLPTFVAFAIGSSYGGNDCLDALSARGDHAIPYVGVILLTLLMACPYEPADGLRTTEVALDAFAWTDSSRARKLQHQSVARHTRGVHVPPIACGRRPVFSLETAFKAFAWSCMMYDFADDDDHALAKPPPQACALPCRCRAQDAQHAPTELLLCAHGRAVLSRQLRSCAHGSGKQEKGTRPVMHGVCMFGTFT